jgi:hypothetical protein
MKKISLFMLAVIAGLGLFAQDNHRLVTTMSTAPHFGIKASVNLAELKISGQPSGSATNTENRTSFSAGFLYSLPLGTMFRLQPELVYSGQGSKLSQTATVLGNTYNSTADLKLNYVNLPVMLQWQTPAGFFVELGPQIGYLTSAKQIATGSNTNSSNETDVKNQMRKMDWGAAGGIGYLSRVGLGIGARYYYGMRNIYDTENQNNANSGEAKNRVISIGLQWQFGAGK